MRRSAVSCAVHTSWKLKAITSFRILTYGGHAVAYGRLANLDILEGEGLVDNSAKMGADLKGLEELRSYPTVGDVRGLGLVFGVEIVKDGATKEKFSEFGEELKTLADNLHDRPTHPSGIYYLVPPPLCISVDEADRIIDILDGAIGDMEDKFGLR